MSDFASLDFLSLKSGIYKYSFKKAYLYRIKNLDMDRVMFQNNKDKLFMLEFINEINLITNTVSTGPIVSNKSFQNSSGSFTTLVKSGDYLTDYIFSSSPVDYYYVISDEKFETDKLLENKRFYFIKPSTNIDFDQHKNFVNSPEAWKKVRSAITLTDIYSYAAASNAKPLIWSIGEIDSFSLRMPAAGVDIDVDGFISQLNAIEKSELTGNIFHHEFALDIVNEKHIILQADAHQIDPALELICQSFDTTKFIPLNYMSPFLGNASPVWSLFGKYQNTITSDATSAKPEADLYRALLTIIFLNYYAKSNFKSFRITNATDPNYGKINIDNDLLYGITVDEEIAKDPKNITALILAKWESDYSIQLNDTSNGYKDVFERIKSYIGMSGKDIASPYSYGVFDDINTIAFDFYFSYDPSQVDLQKIKNRSPFNVRALSNRYEIGAITGTQGNTILGLKKDIEADYPEKAWKLSSQKTYALRNKQNMPILPERLTARDINTRPSNDNLSTNDLFSYQWYKKIKTNYANIYSSSLSGNTVTTQEDQILTFDQFDVNFGNYFISQLHGDYDSWSGLNVESDNEIFGGQRNNYGKVTDLCEQLGINNQNGSLPFNYFDLPSQLNLVYNQTNSQVLNYINSNFSIPSNATVTNPVVKITSQNNRQIKVNGYSSNGSVQKTQQNGGIISFEFTYILTTTISPGNIASSQQIRFPYMLSRASFDNWKSITGENDSKMKIIPLIPETNLSNDFRLKSITWSTLLSPTFGITINGWNKTTKKFIPITFNLKTKFNYDQTIIRGGIDF